MKEKIFSILMVLIVLASTTNLWLSHKGKITFLTDLKQGTDVLFQYRKKTASSLISVKKKIKPEGKVSFEVKGRTLSYFKIDVPEKTVINSVEFRGWKKENITLNAQNEYMGKILKNRISIDLYNLIVLGGFAYYLGWFLIHSLKYGFPKDDPKLPKMMNLEFLRIVFTFVIVWCHFCKNLKFWFVSWLGVEFFFVLSGFLLILTFKPERSYTDFLKDRIIRFMPLIVFSGMIRTIFWKSMDTISDFFFLTPLGLAKTPGVASGSWYLGVLIVVSLFYSYLLKTKKKEDANVIICLISFISAVVLTQYNWKSGVWIAVEPNVIPLPFGLLRGWAGMGIGYFTGLFYLRQKLKDRAKKTSFIVEAAVLFFSVFCLLIKNLYPQNPVYMYMLFSALIVLFANKNGKISRFFEKPVFCRLSKYCLSLYLTHFIIAYSGLYPLLKYYPDYIRAHLVLAAALYFLSAVILAFIAHHAIELPATRALKKHWK